MVKNIGATSYFELGRHCYESTDTQGHEQMLKFLYEKVEDGSSNKNVYPLLKLYDFNQAEITDG